MSQNIIALARFVESTREAGYKSLSAALSELIDNAFEANAACVDIEIQMSTDGGITVSVTDDGIGMSPSVLSKALQFGGSTRFNSRLGAGRYGMGLPNSSLSQARRVEVATWRTRTCVWTSYLDVDEIAAGTMITIPIPKRTRRIKTKSESGTIVFLKKCDRIDLRNERTLLAHLRKSIGQTFRHHIGSGRTIVICNETVAPIDPLFLDKNVQCHGATEFGPSLDYRICRLDSSGLKADSIVKVRFSELPIEKLHDLSNSIKRQIGISKGAGVSVLRSGREIDYGWFFMGEKRRENYDDWWRCEVSFEPDLDEEFGVSVTKQGIRPSERLRQILAPDIERVAHTLNGRVRRRFTTIREMTETSSGIRMASGRDRLLEPPPSLKNRTHSSGGSTFRRLFGPTNGTIQGLNYRYQVNTDLSSCFYEPRLLDNEIVLYLNENHPFYACSFSQAMQLSNVEAKLLFRHLELMLLAAARAECSLTNEDKDSMLSRMREEWSKALATFLE